jgi:selenocysteine lyase/cysteine desulfurase
MATLPVQRHLFELPDDVTYLNCAYMGPLPRRALLAGRQGLERKARPWDILPSEFFQLTRAAREAFARLLGPPARPEDIALVPAASYGMALACRVLPLSPGRRVVALAEEFPSTIVSWREAARAAGADFHLVARPADHDWTAAVLAALDDRTAVAALPGCHWVDGALLDLSRIRDRLDQLGASLALDLTQSLGVMPFDLGRVRPDFLVAPCYKWLLGPYSVGFLYAAPRWQDGPPLEHSWFTRLGAEDFSALMDYRAEFQPGALRYDVGEPANFALLPAAIAALDQLVAWGVPAIYQTAGELADRIVERGRAIGLTAVPDRLRARHYVGLRSARPLPPDLPEQLAKDRVHVSLRGGGRSIRITPHVYNDARDVDRLFACLEPVLS